MHKIYIITLTLLSFCFHANANASETGVYKKTFNSTVDTLYPKLYKALEANRLFVIFEPKISNNLSRFKNKWGKNYNRNQLSSIRSIVFCNPWYANEISNLDPDMLSVCPMHISLYEKDKHTTAVFIRPSLINQNSPALDTLKELEQLIIKAVSEADK